MTDTTKKTATKAALRELLTGRITAAEKLADQLEKVEQAKAAVQQAQVRLAAAAKTARELHDEAVSAGWTAAELKSAGLTPPPAPRGSRGAAAAANRTAQRAVTLVPDDADGAVGFEGKPGTDTVIVRATEHNLRAATQVLDPDGRSTEELWEDHGEVRASTVLACRVHVDIDVARSALVEAGFSVN